jgi:hypothetical protein
VSRSCASTRETLTVLDVQALSGRSFGAERTRDGLAVLLGPAQGIGTARVAVARADGKVRTAILAGVSVGSRRIGKGADPLVRAVFPGFAADPHGGLAVAITAGNRAVSVDLDSMALATHVLTQRTTQRVEKAIEGPQRDARWAGAGLVAVSGSDWSMNADKTVAARAAGVRLVDTATWTTRVLDADASAFSLAPGLVLAYGGSWSGGTSTYTGVHAYALDGTLRWSLYEGGDVYARVVGALGYLERTVGTNRPRHLDVVDPATGAVLGARDWPNGQAMPTLYAGDGSS